MSATDDIVCDALAALLAEHPRDVVTDPVRVSGLLHEHLGTGTPVDDDLVDAVVLATSTPVLRHLADDARADTTEAQLSTELRKLGTAEHAASGAARAWVHALLPDAAHAVPPRAEPVPPRPMVPLMAPPPVPTAGTPVPPVPAVPPLPSVPLVAAAVAPPPPPDPRPDPRPQPVAGVIGGGPLAEQPGRRRRGSAKVVAALFAVLALAAGAIAFVGWNRDPSKDRAASAESEVGRLTDQLGAADKALATANATIAERDSQVAAAKDQIAKMSTLSRAQYNGAQFPEQFTMTGKVAPGSCSLTGDACNVTATVRSIKIACAGKPCDCTSGNCTVTSELWKTASPVKYDAATGLFTAKGLLDGDVFRCGGVAQPTSYEFRFRIAKVTYGDAVWKVSGVDAELAEASSAGAECLAGNRTYALGGPAA